uniref:Myosin motor domain-containing protein n=1 Tax=Amphilophus citrinellus TaxID=61819 RepID=A0A3Q0RJ03_AMPCI
MGFFFYWGSHQGFLPRPQDDFADLCNLPVLNEDSILNNLRTRFYKKKIYTYAGSILIAINPFKQGDEFGLCWPGQQRKW